MTFKKISSITLKIFSMLVLIISASSSCKNDDAAPAPTDCPPSNADCSQVAGIAAISTHSDIVALVTATNNFRASLSSTLLDKSQKCLDEEELYSWSNLPPPIQGRCGVSFGELDAAQKDLLYSVFQAFLSADGYNKVKFITEDIEGFLNTQDSELWSTDYYTFSLFGNPQTDGSWGIQLDGHHLAINFLVHGDEVSMVPAFIGAQPATLNGTRVLGDEEDLGFAVINSLDASQQTTAIIATTAINEIITSPGENATTDDSRNFDYAQFDGIGLQASSMTSVQKENLRTLIKEYVYNLKTPFADAWMNNIEANFDDTYFVWMGATSAGSRIYYRVYNPEILIEFDHANDVDHIHSIIRSPSGNDYGIFALNQPPFTIGHHYLLAAHHQKENTHSHDRIFHSH